MRTYRRVVSVMLPCIVVLAMTTTSSAFWVKGNSVGYTYNAAQNVYEIRFTITSSHANYCPDYENLCGTCITELCGYNYGMNIPGAIGYCPAEPGYSRDWCEGQTFTCYFESNICVKVAADSLQSALAVIDEYKKPRLDIIKCKDRPDAYHLTDDWLPEYDSWLCFWIISNMTMSITLELKTSTYEGIAMNANFPSAVTDSICDLTPDTANPDHSVVWVLPAWSDPYDARHRTFWGSALLQADMPVSVWVHVLDWAADGLLTAYCLVGPEMNQITQVTELIPHNYQRFLSNADPDSDGLTDWEEYRGFDLAGIHVRTDSTFANLFVDDQTGYLNWGTLGTVTDYMCFSAHQVTVKDVDHRKWIDFMKGNAGSLVHPGYDSPVLSPPADVIDLHQAACVFTVNNILTDTFGVTVKTWLDTVYYPRPEGTDGPVQINILEHQEQMAVFELHGLLPRDTDPVVYDRVFNQYLNRTCFHELGHVLGIFDHRNDPWQGDYRCVMTYDSADDWPNNQQGWAGFTYGEGYLAGPHPVDWKCADQKGLRP
jgi:hypothetical protein